MTSQFNFESFPVNKGAFLPHERLPPPFIFRVIAQNLSHQASCTTKMYAIFFWVVTHHGDRHKPMYNWENLFNEDKGVRILKLHNRMSSLALFDEQQELLQ